MDPEKQNSRISVVGLGKLGLGLAACFAERGFETLGVDVQDDLVAFVNQGKAPFFEPGLDALLARHGGTRLRATTKHAEAIAETAVTFLLLPTPSYRDGRYSTRFIEPVLAALGHALRESGKVNHHFVISSTVMPGDTASAFVPLLETAAGRSLNQGFSICYIPDFVALGNVIQGFLNPDLVLIGESSAAAGARLETIYKQMCTNQPKIARMSLVSAELAKVFLNAYITTKISFANSIANVCEKIAGADVDAITDALGADRRIAPYYFQAGPSYGGACFPRDTRAYIALANEFGVQSELIEAVERVNQFQDQQLAEMVLDELERSNNQTVGILGLAFTNNTAVLTESPAVKLIHELLKRNIRIVAFDALAIENAKALFGSQIEYAASVQECVAAAGLAVLTLRSKSMAEQLTHYQPQTGLTLIDCWRVVDSTRLSARYKYLALGKAMPPEPVGEPD